MTSEEKFKLLRSYRFIQMISRSPGRMPINSGFLPGIPRLGIPGVEFIGSAKDERKPAGDEKTLKLGFVNLIRDNEKTQVFGNFDEASAVDRILGPGRAPDIRALTKSRKDLQDLDLFLVQDGTGGQVRKYVCARHRELDEFNCVAARLELIMSELGIDENYDELLEQEKLTTTQLDRLTGEVLDTMDELKIL